MLTKKFEDIKITINFNLQTYLTWLCVALIVSVLSYLLIVNIPKIGILGFLGLILIYFLPSIIAFDLLAQYQKDHSIPRLPHPKRFGLFFWNAILGWTGIFWLFLLARAINLGEVVAQKITYEELI